MWHRAAPWRRHVIQVALPTLAGTPARHAGIPARPNARALGPAHAKQCDTPRDTWVQSEARPTASLPTRCLRWRESFVLSWSSSQEIQGTLLRASKSPGGSPRRVVVGDFCWESERASSPSGAWGSCSRTTSCFTLASRQGRGSPARTCTVRPFERHLPHIHTNTKVFAHTHFSPALPPARPPHRSTACDNAIQRVAPLAAPTSSAASARCKPSQLCSKASWYT